MRHTTREDDGAIRPELARGPPRGGSTAPVGQTPLAARLSVARLVRGAASSAWPGTGLLVVGLLVLIVDIGAGLQRVAELPQRAGAQPTLAAARPATAMAQAAVVATVPPTFAPIPTAVLPNGETGLRSPAQAAAPGPPQPPEPTATPTSELSTASPEGAVRSFYYLLGQRDFQSVAWLVTAHMRDTMPTDPGLLRDRTPPGQLMIQQLTVLSVDQAGNSATVGIDVVKQLSPAVARRYVGNWRLVRGPAGWLLDEPDIHFE